MSELFGSDDRIVKTQMKVIDQNDPLGFIRATVQNTAIGRPLPDRIGLLLGMGVEARIISPEEAREKWPLIRIDDLLGAAWLPHDGKVIPKEVPVALCKAATGRGVSVEPKDLGELTVSMLKGEAGFQAKEIGKLVSFLQTRPPFDVVTLPVSLLIGLAGPLKQALGRPVVCVLQGEDLFLDFLSTEHRGLAQDLIRAHAQGGGFPATVVAEVKSFFDPTTGD